MNRAARRIRRPSARPGFTLIELLVVVSIVGLLTTLILPAVQSSREAARRTQCVNNLKQIGLAMHNYHATYDTFPPAGTVDAEGKPLLSWRVLLLPFLEQDALYRQFHLDEAWASTQEFGGRLMNSMWTLSTMVGASVTQLTLGTIVANLGFSEATFPHPLRPGDTLYSETTVLDKRLSNSRPGQGIVTLEHVGRNQDGVVVGRAVRTTLVHTAPASAPTS